MRDLLRIRRKLWLATCVALVGAVSTLQLGAQDLPNAEVFIGLSFRNTALASDYETAPGIFASPGTATARVGFRGLRGGVGLRLNSRFTLVADTSFHYGFRGVVTPRACSQPSPYVRCFRTGEAIAIYDFLGGLRVSQPGRSLTPFFHMLFGPISGEPLGGAHRGLAVALGGGMEFRSRRESRFILRVQLEDVPKRISNRWTNDVQLAVGPLFRFGKGR